MRFEEYIRQFMHFTRITLNGFELFIRLKCGCELASYPTKLLFVYRRITIHWPTSFQFHHSSFYFCYTCTHAFWFFGYGEVQWVLGIPKHFVILIYLTFYYLNQAYSHAPWGYTWTCRVISAIQWNSLAQDRRLISITLRPVINHTHFSICG